MAKKRLNNWRRRLPMFSLGLVVLASLAPLSEIPHGILVLTASMGMLVYHLTYSPESRREVALLLIALAVLIPFALLISIDPKWVIFGSIGVCIGIPLWEILRDERGISGGARTPLVTLTAAGRRANGPSHNYVAGQRGRRDRDETRTVGPGAGNCRSQ